VRPIPTPTLNSIDRKPGAWVMAQSMRRERVLWIAAGILLLILSSLTVALVRGYHLPILAAAVFGVGVLAVRRPAREFADRHLRLLGGAVAERRVGETLNELSSSGWRVLHDIEQRLEGNIDHLASGPNGVFLIETKHHRYKRGDLTKAKRQAAKVHDELGVYVTPVICLDDRSGGPFRCRTRAGWFC
jgi:Nuclease-related domain